MDNHVIPKTGEPRQDQNVGSGVPQQPYQAPPPPPYYAQQPYQAPPYYANNNARKPTANGFAIAALVLGIVSIVFMAVEYIAITCAIAAIVFSILSKKKGKSGQATAGLVLGIISLPLSVIMLIGSLVPKTGSSNQSVTPGSAPARSVAQGSVPGQSVIASSQEVESRPPLLSTDMQEITLGDVVVTEKWEVSIQSVNFEPYEDGNVWFNVYLTTKNLQRSAEDPFGWFDPIIDLELNYNDGYTYGGTTGFGSNTYLDPLETASDIEYSISCPQEVEDNMDAPLFLVLSVEGVRYKLIIR